MRYLVLIGCMLAASTPALADPIITPDQIRSVPADKLLDPKTSEAARLRGAQDSAEALLREYQRSRLDVTLMLPANQGTLAHPAMPKPAKPGQKVDLLSRMLTGDPTTQQTVLVKPPSSAISINTAYPNGMFYEPACNPKTAPDGAC